MAPRLIWLVKKPLVITAVLLLLAYLELYSGRCTTDVSETRDVIQVPVQCVPRIEGSLTVTIPAEINNSDTAYRKQWLEKRQQQLQNGTSKKVLLLTYMRGGSTIAGEIFNQNQDALLWYEPGDAFFVAYYGIPEETLPQHDLFYRNGSLRSLSEDERQSMASFFENELNCSYEQLPVEATTHHFLMESSAFRNYTNCLGPHIGKGKVLIECIRYIAPICGTTVETSTAEKCHILLQLTKEVFREDEEAVDSMRESFRKLTRLIPQGLHDLFISRLIAKMRSSGQQFDPRLRSKLSWFIHHRLCLESVQQDNNQCIGDLVKRCQASKLQVLEVNRMHLEDTQLVLERIPDLYVFYFVRDPRAIAVSRNNTKHMVTDITAFSPLKEAQLVCTKIANDFSRFRLLRERYPEAYHMVKYEQLVLDPEGTAAQIYETIGESVPASWTVFAQKARALYLYYNRGLNVSNDPVDVMNRWRTQLSEGELDQMNRYCEPILMALNYEL